MTLLLGDSIAVGIAPFAHVRHVDAVTGRGSRAGAHAALRYRDRTVLVSLGANDAAAGDDRFERRVRNVLVHRSCVAWLTVPSRPWVRRALRRVRRHDRRLHIVSVSGVRHVDGVHSTPAGYRELARRLVSACSRA